jgi:membrane-associated phospholipid phosphatase
MLQRSPDPSAAGVARALEKADVDLGVRLASAKDDPVVRCIGALSEVGDQPPLAGLAAVVLAYGLAAGDRRAAGAGGRMLGALAAAIVVKTVLKRSLSRTRPNVVIDEGRYETELFGAGDGSRQSFPSGHTAGSVAVARAVGRAYPALRGPAYAAAAAIGLAQLPRGAHFPSDVAAGVLVGLCAEAVGEALARRLTPPHRSGPRAERNIRRSSRS